MIRAAFICAALFGCTPVDGQLRSTDGQPVDYANVFMAPLCLFICPVTLTTSGVDTDTIGDGATGTGTASQTVTQTTGAN